MKVKFGDKEIKVTNPHQDPLITLDADEIDENRWAMDVGTVEITNHEGIRARFWLRIRMNRGRPKLLVATNPHKDREGNQVERSVQGTFNLL